METRTGVEDAVVDVHRKAEHQVVVAQVLAQDVHGVQSQQFLDSKLVFIEYLRTPLVGCDVVWVGADTLIVEGNHHVEFD